MMKTFTPPRLVAEGGSLLASTDPLAALDNLGFHLTCRTLEGRGNKLSAAHRDFLQSACIILGVLANGSKGRYVFDLPAGLGKTTLLVCWTKAMIALGLDWSIAICASRVEELADVQKELTSGERPVPMDEIGLWHAKDDAAVPPTFTRRDADKYGSKRVLLLTHSRMQKGQEVARWLQYKGRPRDLVVYDESLSTTAVWEASYAGVVGEIKKVWAAAGQEGPVAAFLKHLMDDLDEEVASQKAGAAPKRLRLPSDDPELLREVQRLVRRQLGPGGELEDFLRNAEADVRAVVAKNDGVNATLIRTYTAVPDELGRMVVLDASFPIRTLLKLGNERIHESAKDLQLKPMQQAWWFTNPHFKRYDHVTIHLMPTRKSGRTFAIDDLLFGDDFSTIDKEIASVVAEMPVDEAVLIWTFLQQPQMPDFRARLREALSEAGVEAGGELEVDGRKKPRIVIETFGRETATNAYRYCTNVIFTGCLELPRETLVAQYIAETRDLTIPVTSEDIDRLNRGEVWHRIYQGINRGACRDVRVDNDGRTQAKRTNVWLFTRFHKYIKDELGGALPGAQWKHWAPRYLAEDTLAKEATGSLLIRKILDSLERDKISSRALKKMDPFLSNLSMKTFQRARKLAAEGTHWMLEGSSLVRLRTSPGLKTAA